MEAKITGIKSNPGECRTEEEIRVQTEQELALRKARKNKKAQRRQEDALVDSVHVDGIRSVKDAEEVLQTFTTQQAHDYVARQLINAGKARYVLPSAVFKGRLN